MLLKVRSYTRAQSATYEEGLGGEEGAPDWENGDCGS